MAQEEIILKLNIDTGDSVNEIEAVEKQFEKIDLAAEETGETIAAMTKKMELYKSAALKAGATSPIGKEAIKKAADLQGELDKVNELVTRNNTDFDKFRSVVGISQTAINSYGAFQAVSAIVGVENEKLMETMVKLQAAQQLLNTLEGVRAQLLQKNAVITKGLTAVQKAYTMAVGTSSKGLKIFRLALISTGIGAIVVGIGLLIANFGKVSEWVQKLVKRFKFLQLAIAPLILLFDLVKQGLQELGIIDDENTAKAKANAEARVENLKKEEEAIGSRYDFEIAKAQAAGENTFELEEEKRKALAERIKAEAKAIVELVKLNGEFTDDQKERVKELSKQFKKLSQETAVARIKEEKRVTDEFKKELDVRAKAGEKKAQDDAKLLAEEQQRADEQFDLMNELILSAQDLELQNLAKYYDDKFALAEGNAELEKQLTIKQEEDIAQIKSEYANKKLEAEREQAFALMEMRLELKEIQAGELSDDASPEEVAEYYAARNEIEDEQRELLLEKAAADNEAGLLTDEAYNKRKEIIDAQSANVKKKIAADETAFKRKMKDQEVANAFAGAQNILGSVSTLAEEGSGIAKTAAVASATMDTYKAAIGAYSSASSIPVVGWLLGPVAAALAVGVGIANVKKIVSTKTPGNKGGGASVPTPPSTGAFSQATSIVDNPEGVLTDDLLNGTGGDEGTTPTQPALKVEVLESDIKKASDSNAQSVTTSQL